MGSGADLWKSPAAPFSACTLGEVEESEPFRGSTSAATRHQLAARRYRRLHRDVYVRADVEDNPLLRLDAVLLSLPEARASHRTAALLWRLPVDDDGKVHVVLPPTLTASKLPDVVTHRGRLRPGDSAVVRGRRVTSLARTWLDLAAVLPLDELVAAGDVVVRRGGAADLRSAVAAARRVPGVRRAREALPLLDGRAASPGETRARLLLHRAGFTSLVPAVVLRDASGGWLGEADLGDEAARVAVQYDGLVHWQAGPRQWRADVARDELARCAGWQVVVLTSADLARPDRAVALVRGAYARAAAGRAA